MDSNILSSLHQIREIMLQISPKVQRTLEQPFESFGQSQKMDFVGRPQTIQMHQDIQSEMVADFQGIHGISN